MDVLFTQFNVFNFIEAVNSTTETGFVLANEGRQCKFSRLYTFDFFVDFERKRK